MESVRQLLPDAKSAAALAELKRRHGPALAPLCSSHGCACRRCCFLFSFVISLRATRPTSVWAPTAIRELDLLNPAPRLQGSHAQTECELRTLGRTGAWRGIRALP